MKYIYDATGRKLSQQVYNSANSLVKKTDYVGEYVYENDVLQFVNHEEGRITQGPGGKQMIPSPQLVPNGDAVTTAGFEPNASVTITNETQSSETYLKVVSNQAISTPGFMSRYITVKPGKNYRYKFKGYRTTSVAYLYVTGEVAGNIVWATHPIPSGAGNEAWVTADFTVPANVTQIKVGALWSPVTIGDIIYANKVELYEIDPINGTNIEVDVASAPTEYQYHLKDHLGNVRLTFTAQEESEAPVATLETANASTERAMFLKYDDVRKVNAAIFDKTNNPALGGTQYSVRLSGTTHETYGLARSIAVMPGDKIKAEVYAKYVDPAAGGLDAALLTLLSQVAGGTVPAGSVVDGGAYGTAGAGSVPFGSLLSKSNETGTAPKAYLNWIVFDKNFVPIYDKSDYQRMSQVARETGAPTAEGVPHELLQSPEITIAEPGYVYIYFSNEEAGKEVYFDDFMVTHTKSPVIQSDNYYPFGLTFNSYKRENSVYNKYQFNGKELQDELSLGWYDYHARQYDPTIARWMAIDPFTEVSRRWSPYVYAYNNPLRFIDPDGMLAEDVVKDDKRPRGATIGVGSHDHQKVSVTYNSGKNSSHTVTKTSYKSQGSYQYDDEGNATTWTESVSTTTTTSVIDKQGAVVSTNQTGSTSESVFKVETGIQATGLLSSEKVNVKGELISSSSASTNSANPGNLSDEFKGAVSMTSEHSRLTKGASINQVNSEYYTMNPDMNEGLAIMGGIIAPFERDTQTYYERSDQSTWNNRLKSSSFKNIANVVKKWYGYK